ncbi:MAG: RNA polymerase subunit sigma-70, partial [Gemmatimonadetes bacterium]|nr:RNA polymerase subunit sigma-70 [Gemmatimonadota bacterium]
MLSALRDGEGEALNRLLPIVYDELRRMARRQLGRERPGHTLHATALVHEAYFKLARAGPLDV